MLRLKIQTEPYWLDIGSGVRVKVRPCNSAVFYEAKAYMNSKISEQALAFKDGSPDSPDLNNPKTREAYADEQLVIGLALAGIIEWEGVLEADSDAKAPLVESKIIELFSNFWALAESFRNQYCGIRELLEAEKNASAPEPDGILVTGENTANPAKGLNHSAR